MTSEALYSLQKKTETFKKYSNSVFAAEYSYKSPDHSTSQEKSVCWNFVDSHKHTLLISRNVLSDSPN